MPPHRRPNFNSSKFKELVKVAGNEITTSIQNSAAIEHDATAGPMREDGFRAFLSRLLSEKYFVGTGFAFDARDSESRQLDIVIAMQPPLGRVFEKHDICKLPCEVVLAVIEVKKILNSTEIEKSLENAASIRALYPYGDQSFVSARPGGATASATKHRCFYAVVALESLLTKQDWATKELNRINEKASLLDLPNDLVDRLVILDRGVLNVVERKALSSDGAIESPVFEWFIHLANHLDREARRRPPLDIDVYAGRRSNWVTLRRQ